MLITAPDRLARSYVHQAVLIDDLAQHGCSVMFLDCPMSADPHDHLLLHIGGAVAEYERVRISDRMRRGRQAKLCSGQLLPWTVPPYGYILGGERSLDPHTVRVDSIQAAIVAQIFAWFTDPEQPVTLQWIAHQLATQGVPAPKGGKQDLCQVLREPMLITKELVSSAGGRMVAASAAGAPADYHRRAGTTEATASTAAGLLSVGWD